MEALIIPAIDKAAEPSLRSRMEPLRLYEEDLDVLAFELWQEASCPEGAAEARAEEHDPLWCHASCL
jgi:hypothetical protein